PRLPMTSPDPQSTVPKPHLTLSQPWGDPDFDPSCEDCRAGRHGRLAVSPQSTVPVEPPAQKPPIYCTGGCDACRDYARELGVPLIVPSLDAARASQPVTATPEPLARLLDSMEQPNPLLSEDASRAYAAAAMLVREVLAALPV